MGKSPWETAIRLPQPVGDYHDKIIQFLGKAEHDVEKNEDAGGEDHTVTRRLTHGVSDRKTDDLHLQRSLATCSLCS